MMLSACKRFDSSIPTGWALVPIGKRIALEYGSGLTDAERTPGDYQVFGSNGPVGTHNKYLVEGPGILVGRKGSVGEVHFSEGNFWPIDTVYYVTRKANDDLRYIACLLEFLRLDNLTAATGVPGLTRRDALFMLGAFPPPVEQSRIAETLKAADDHIRALEEQIRKVERVKKALIRDLFTKGICNGSGRAYRKTEIGTVPSDWIVAPLAKICEGPDCVKTGPFGAQLPPDAFATSGIRMLNITDIGDGEVVWKSDFYVTAEAFTRLRDYELCEGDIAFSRVADVGRLACIRKELEPLLMSSNCIRLRTKPAFNAKFLTHAFQDADSVSRQVVAMSNGGGRPIVTPRFLRQIKVPRPPIEEQNEIAVILEHGESLITSVKAQLTAARRVKQSLLQNLLTGKIRLKP